MPKMTMSKTKMIKVRRVARLATNDMRIVPVRWYAAPHMPKMTAMPARPAACRKYRSVYVLSCM
jgi:hypothetical protein